MEMCIGGIVLSKNYEKYFLNKDFKEGITNLAFDIKKHKISKEDVGNIADRLVGENLITASSEFKKLEMDKWDENHLVYIIGKCGYGEISKDYLLYYSDVARHIQGKKNKKIMIIAGIIITILGLASYAYLKSQVGHLM